MEADVARVEARSGVHRDPAEAAGVAHPGGSDDHEDLGRGALQNVLGILNDLNKANNELDRLQLRGAKSRRRQTVRGSRPLCGVGAGFLPERAGRGRTGRPGPDGWVWEPNLKIAPDVLKTLEISQGKHKPAFVPLPVKIQ
jgi:hypothetical protein